MAKKTRKPQEPPEDKPSIGPAGDSGPSTRGMPPVGGRTQVGLTLTAHAAQALLGLMPATPISQHLQALVKRLGVELIPVFPGRSEPELQCYFLVETSDRNSAESVIRELQTSSAISNAYLMPAPEPAAGSIKQTSHAKRVDENRQKGNTRGKDRQG